MDGRPRVRPVRQGFPPRVFYLLRCLPRQSNIVACNHATLDGVSLGKWLPEYIATIATVLYLVSTALRAQPEAWHSNRGLTLSRLQVD